MRLERTGAGFSTSRVFEPNDLDFFDTTARDNRMNKLLPAAVSVVAASGGLVAARNYPRFSPASGLSVWGRRRCFTDRSREMLDVGRGLSAGVQGELAGRRDGWWVDSACRCSWGW